MTDIRITLNGITYTSTTTTATTTARDPRKPTAGLLKAVPNDTMARRLSRAINKPARPRVRGMISNKPYATNYCSVKPTRLLPSAPTTTNPHYDVDTFGLRRAAAHIER